MKVTLKQLEVFSTVAREGSVTKAALRLHLTQSATSMALSDLEAQLGDKLFDRVGRRLRINALGQQLLPLALQAIASVQEMEDICQHGQHLPSHLHISASLTVGNYILPSLMGDFVQRYPQIDIQLTIANTQQIIAAVKEFACDLGFIEGICHDPDIQVTPWLNDDLVIFCATSHPLAQQASVSLLELSETPWVLRESGSGTREAFDLLVAPQLSRYQVRMALGHGEAIRRAVEAGIGLGFASRLSLDDAIALGTVKVLQTPLHSLQRSLSILRHKQKYQSHAIDLFINTITT